LLRHLLGGVDDLTGPIGVEEWLGVLGQELPGPGTDLEYSIRLSAAGVGTSGRCNCWVGADFPAIGRVLRRLGAPPIVLAEQAGPSS
jgi:hypothetical protein